MGLLTLPAAQKLKTKSLYKETKDPVGTSFSCETEVRRHASADACDNMLGRCSVRDLIKRNRSY